jgi:hypothetical protein
MLGGRRPRRCTSLGSSTGSGSSTRERDDLRIRTVLRLLLDLGHLPTRLSQVPFPTFARVGAHVSRWIDFAAKAGANWNRIAT